MKHDGERARVAGLPPAGRAGTKNTAKNVDDHDADPKADQAAGRSADVAPAASASEIGGRPGFLGDLPPVAGCSLDTLAPHTGARQHCRALACPIGPDAR